MSQTNQHLVFASMPKTGTTWVEKAIRDGGNGEEYRLKGNKHLTTDTEFNRGLTNPRRLSLTIVRDLRTWLPSAWVFHRADGKKWRPMPGPGEVLAGCVSDTFEGFVVQIIKRPGVVGFAFGAYESSADVILKNETLAADLAESVLRAYPKDKAKAAAKVVLQTQEVNRTDREKLPKFPADLWAALADSEYEYLERHGYK